MEHKRYIDPDTTDPTECMDLMLLMLKAASDLHMATNYPMLPQCTFGYDLGRRYAKFWKDNGTQRAICFFVDRKTGEVWKGSWHQPVRNFVRGNIFTKEGRVLIIGDRTMKSNFYHYAAF